MTHEERTGLIARLRYAVRPVEAALRAIEGAHPTMAELLDAMTEADGRRAGTRSEAGPYSAEDWLRFLAAHTHDHAAQIRQTCEGGAVGQAPTAPPRRLGPPAPRLALR